MYRVRSLSMSGFWAFFWLAVVLKIPILALLWIVWWAVKEPPAPEAEDDEGGGSDREPWHPRRRPPHPPRRGPHRDPAPRSPARVRVARVRRHVTAGHR
jgi:hypothetical protein